MDNTTCFIIYFGLLASLFMIFQLTVVIATVVAYFHVLGIGRCWEYSKFISALFWTIMLSIVYIVLLNYCCADKARGLR